LFTIRSHGRDRGPALQHRAAHGSRDGGGSCPVLSAGPGARSVPGRLRRLSQAPGHALPAGANPGTERPNVLNCPQYRSAASNQDAYQETQETRVAHVAPLRHQEETGIRRTSASGRQGERRARHRDRVLAQGPRAEAACDRRGAVNNRKCLRGAWNKKGIN